MLNLSRSFQTLCGTLLVILGGATGRAQNYTLTNLTSDGSVTADNKDTHMVNPWGLSRSSGSPWWMSDNRTGLSTLYDGTGATLPLVVTIPAAEMGKTGSPTGTIFNPTAAFPVTTGHPALFLFCTQDGTIAGWNGGATATTLVKNAGAIYTGMTAGKWKGAEVLYVANFASGHVEAYDASLKPIHLGWGAFRVFWFREEEALGFGRLANPVEFSPYNIQNIGGTLFVTFAVPDATKLENVAGAGLGLVAAFTPGGRLIRVYQPGSFLNGPWGIAMAPSDFGAFSHCLLVGNFTSGEIIAYNVESGQYVGTFLDPSGKSIVIDGLWALSFGSGGGKSGNLNTLYVTSGPTGQTHGLFQSLVPVATTQPGNDF